MKIATWNINGVRARLPNVLEWLKEAQPDVVCLQETKCEDDKFPGMEIEELGYNIALHGQKGFNGVAILSKHPMSDITRGLPGDDGDPQARYIEASIGIYRVVSLYLPNGNPVDTDKFPYKLAWLERLAARARTLLAEEHNFLLCGDYNVCPTDLDVYDPIGWAGDALCRIESRLRFRALANLGLTEAYRALHPHTVAYSFWDYQAGAWRKNQGLRIDHLMLAPQVADRLLACDIDKDVRGKDKSSDHVPVWGVFKSDG